MDNELKMEVWDGRAGKAVRCPGALRLRQDLHEPADYTFAGLEVMKIRINHSSLRQRLTLQLTTMIVGLLLLGSAAVVGINGLHQDFGKALAGYQELRSLYEIGARVSAAQSALRSAPSDPRTAGNELRAALLRLNLLMQGSAEHEPALIALRKDLLAAQSLEAAALDPALSRIAALSSDIRGDIEGMQRAADARRRETLMTIIIVSVIVVIGGILIGIQQYRAVMKPLSRIGDAVRTVAGGKFGLPIDTAGDREFALLAGDFNRMAAELQNLYRELEAKVAIKSKALVRSERLASVGFLAAGVAHEINNPLSIITGYGERAMQQLDRNSTDPQRIRNAIAVMCEEAFRCKQITDRLLKLARPGGEDRVRICLADLAHDVISTVGGLPEYREKRLVLESGQRHLSEIVARPGEIKQVILNLVINALEAVEPQGGEVKLTIASDERTVELSVIDNGRGMDAETLDRVFEPFFTLKRAGRAGTGLGLSISHAIIADHGGTIAAASDGDSLGSRFTVTLPAAVSMREGVDVSS
jgi:signal transduction histidine kinase